MNLECPKKNVEKTLLAFVPKDRPLLHSSTVSQLEANLPLSQDCGKCDDSSGECKSLNHARPSVVPSREKNFSAKYGSA